MRPSTRRALAAACAALLLPAGAAAQEAAPLDPSTVLDHVRPELRDALAAQAGVASLDALPTYDLHLSVADDLHGFGLREVVTFTNVESAPVDALVLRLFANATVPEGEAPPVSLVGGECLDGASCELAQPSPTTIEIRPSAPIAPGARLRVSLDLRGAMREIDASRTNLLAQGLEGMASMEHGSSEGYGLLAHGEGVGSLAGFFPVIARRERGRWVRDDDGPNGDLGTDALCHVRARVVVPAAFRVAASGVERARRPVRDADGRPARHEVEITAGAVRDFAVLVSESLVSVERRVGDVTVRAFHLPGDARAGARVLDTAAEALRIFEARFGAYPYTELDLVEAPLVGGAGGVEFSGLVTVASMFYRPMMPGALGALLGAGGGLGRVDELGDAMLEFVTAHEVAHQWWHGVVGSDSRAHPFVDESLAQWSAVLYMEDAHGRERAATEAERQVAMNYVMMRLRGAPDARVDQPASAFDTPLAYAGIVYGKAPFLWSALRETLGDEEFFAGVRAYVERYRMGLAPPDALVDVLAGAADRRTGARVRRLARRWLEERHGDADLGPIESSRLGAGMLGLDPSALGAGDLDPAALAGLLGGAGGLGGAGDLGGLGDLGSLIGALGGTGPDGAITPEAQAALIEQLVGALGSLGGGADGADLGALQELLHGGLGAFLSGELDEDDATRPSRRRRGDGRTPRRAPTPNDFSASP